MPSLLDYFRPQPRPPDPPFGSFNSRVTYYAPGPGDRMEGGFETSRPNPITGKSVPATLDNYRLGYSPFVTLAGDPSRYGQAVNMGPLTYTSPIDQKSYTLPDVTGVVHDTGSAFKGRPDKLDVAAGDYRGWGPQAASAAVQADGGRRTVTPVSMPQRPSGMDMEFDPWTGQAPPGGAVDSPAEGPTAVASGPPQQRQKSMPQSLMDMFQPTDAAGEPTTFDKAIAGQRQGLIGFGLGLASPAWQGESQMSNALQGYQRGAALDTRQASDAAKLKHLKAQDARQALQDALAAQRDARDYGLRERQFKASQEVKPSVHWTADRTDEKGDTIPGKPYLINPNGSYRELTLEGAQNLSSALPQTGAVPGQASADTSTTDEGAIPPSATTVQAAPGAALPLNRREAIKSYSKEKGEQTAKTEERGEAGSRIFKLIDSLEEKVKDPLFKEAAGPTREYASGQPVWNPARAIYEYNPLGASEKAKTHLDIVKSDAQGINSELQRAYLSGQGQVTEAERAQINQIFGNIAAARSPEAAQAMLKNAREIITTAFQRGYATPGAAEGAKPAPAKTGLEGMSKKEMQQELIRRGVLSANST